MKQDMGGADPQPVLQHAGADAPMAGEDAAEGAAMSGPHPKKGRPYPYHTYPHTIQIQVTAEEYRVLKAVRLQMQRENEQTAMECYAQLLFRGLSEECRRAGAYTGHGGR